MKLVKLKCNSCGAKIDASDQIKKVTCNFCGSTFFVDDEVQRIEINKNIKYTDEARLKENDVKLMELEYRYRDSKFNNFINLFKNDNFILLFIFIICFAFLIFVPSYALGPEDDEVVIPLDAKKYKGENYKQVVQQLEDAGFKDVDVDPIYDIVTGWLTEDGEVEQVSIGGDTEFKKGEYISEDAHVVVTYHTFKKNKK